MADSDYDGELARLVHEWEIVNEAIQQKSEEIALLKAQCSALMRSEQAVAGEIAKACDFTENISGDTWCPGVGRLWIRVGPLPVHLSLVAYRNA